jgi:hypothetical protein
MCFPEDVKNNARVKRDSIVQLLFKDLKEYKIIENRQGAQFLRITMKAAIESEVGDGIGDSILFYIDDEMDQKHFQTIIVERIHSTQSTLDAKKRDELDVVPATNATAKTTSSELRSDLITNTGAIRSSTTASRKPKKTIARVAFRSPTSEAVRDGSIPADSSPTPKAIIVVRETPERKQPCHYNNVTPAIEKEVQCNEVASPVQLPHTSPCVRDIPSISSKNVHGAPSPLPERQTINEFKSEYLAVPEQYADNPTALGIAECLDDVKRRTLIRLLEAKEVSERREAQIGDKLLYMTERGRERFERKLWVDQEHCTPAED